MAATWAFLASDRVAKDGRRRPAKRSGKSRAGRAEHGLLRAVDDARDHIRGGTPGRGRAKVLIYGDYLCPYCRRLKGVLDRLRATLGERATYAYRQFPNEKAHPGAEFAARAAEAAGRQGKFWEMHDALYQHEPELREQAVLDIARSLGLDVARLRADIDADPVRRRVDEDLSDGRRDGVTGTPTIFVDGVRYDGAWDFYSMLEALDRPVGARVQRTARAFANLPTSAGLVLLAAAAVAMVFANGPLAAVYQQVVSAQIGLGPPRGGVWLSVADWCSEGLLAIFFLIVGLEIRREISGGSLSQPRAAAAPVIAALGGVLVPAAIYLAFNPGPTARGWPGPVDTGIPFTLGGLAIVGGRASASLKAFIAAYGVVDDLLSLVILAIFFPHNLAPGWLLGALGAGAVMFTLNRWRVYAGWTYWTAAIVMWLTLHLAGVSGALAGVALAACLPTRPSPAAGPLLAQAATALAELEHAERNLKQARDPSRRVEQEPVWDWASRNLSAAAARLLSPAERVERDLAPWSTYVVLPLFAFTAAGIPLGAKVGGPDAWRVFAGVAVALAVGKPVGIVLATWLGERARLVVGPPDAAPAALIGAACLCGIGDPLSILMVEQSFAGGDVAAVAKLGVLVGSVASAVLGAIALTLSPPPMSKA
jgi:NhaA family Na+:H+ antiporter